MRIYIKKITFHTVPDCSQLEETRLALILEQNKGAKLGVKSYCQ